MAGTMWGEPAIEYSFDGGKSWQRSGPMIGRRTDG
jgi:hypothetical protein